MPPVRNIGIIAHIDAGKTTLSERLLFFTQKIHCMGEVHDGTATMDFLPEEQERGITITSACTSCTWHEYTINLIDTPGHVDFTMEVERSLRVLDGAVGVFCAVGGVEPQSETVWRQSESFQVPKLIFINKMDRLGADFEGTLQAIHTRLQTQALPVTIPTTIPVNSTEEFCEIIDLINQERLSFSQEDQGQTITRTPLTEKEQQFAEPWRTQLLEGIADHDDTLLQAYLNETLTPEIIHAALRRVTLARAITPVFVGSALKNIGVQPLLDGVCAYLPSPQDIPLTLAYTPSDATTETAEKRTIPCTAKDPFMALAFKVFMEEGHKLTLLRIYAGTLREKDSIANVTQNTDDRAAHLYRMHANRREAIQQAEAGDIIGVIGLRSAHTGDTYADTKNSPLLESIQTYKAVISIALEPSNAEEGATLDEALAHFILEDPTLTVQTDEASGHRILSGMGELHLDVTLERMAREYRITPRKGNPQVVRRETILKELTGKGIFDRELGKEHHYGEVHLRLIPLARGSGTRIHTTIDPKTLPKAFLEEAKQGIDNALQSSPQSGYPLDDIEVHLEYIGRTENNSTSAGTHMAAGVAMRTALESTKLAILEPLMFVEILVPENHLGAAINLFATRHGQVENILDANEARANETNAQPSGLKILQGTAPLSQLFGFSTDLRSATQGRAGLTLRFERFDLV